MRNALNVMAVFSTIVCVAMVSPDGVKAQPVDGSMRIDPDLRAAGFMAHHPDVSNREIALMLIGEGQYERGLKFLERAARYADKPSQAMLAEAYWEGRFGLAPDRAIAYAWMDLAAERGYSELVTLRERYWWAMTDNERSSALELGGPLYARYGDDVARPKLATVLRRGLRDVTGSRTGYSGHVTILGPLPDGGNGGSRSSGDSENSVAPMAIIPGSKFYQAALWRPNQYFERQDLQWRESIVPALFPNVKVGKPVDVTTQRDNPPA